MKILDKLKNLFAEQPLIKSVSCSIEDEKGEEVLLETYRGYQILSKYGHFNKTTYSNSSFSVGFNSYQSSNGNISYGYGFYVIARNYNGSNRDVLWVQQDPDDGCPKTRLEVVKLGIKIATERLKKVIDDQIEYNNTRLKWNVEKDMIISDLKRSL
jgi:hypothetical protein